MILTLDLLLYIFLLLTIKSIILVLDLYLGTSLLKLSIWGTKSKQELVLMSQSLIFKSKSDNLFKLSMSLNCKLISLLSIIFFFYFSYFIKGSSSYIKKFNFFNI